MGVLGLVLTLLASMFAAQADRRTESRLLAGQSRRAAMVLQSALVAEQLPLQLTIGALAAADRVHGGHLTEADRVHLFDAAMAPSVGRDRPFVDASLWRLPVPQDGGPPRQVMAIGAAPALQSATAVMRALLRRASADGAPTVARVGDGARLRIGYALSADAGRYAVYAERALPADRRSPVDRDSAFADLHYAIYLGAATRISALLTTDVPVASLPLTGPRYRTTVPFADTVLTLATAPRRHLGSTLSQRLYWMLLLAGLVLTVAAAAVAYRLSASRRRLNLLYDEQRGISMRLQAALAPEPFPSLPGFDVASGYVPATAGVNVGGDWFIVCPVEEDRVAFAIGDVTGHGLDAVALMARARFIVGAYLGDGESPGRALTRAARHVDFTRDGHMVTVLAGVVDPTTDTMILASAGHLPPVLVHAGSAQFVELQPGLPLGLGAVEYADVKRELPRGALLLAYTDGLVERRTQHIDVGMAELLRTLQTPQPAALSDLVQEVLTAMANMTDGTDDVAVLALRPGAHRAARARPRTTGEA